MRLLAISLQKDWARVRRDPFSLLTALGIPLVLAVLMSLVFGRQPAAPQGRLLLVDEDNSIASSRILEAFHHPPLDKMLHIEKVARAVGRERIDRGDASALLIIPQGFQQAFLLNQPFGLQLFTNPSERILPEMIEESLSLSVDAAFYMRRSNFAPNPAQDLIALKTDAVHQPRPARNFAAVFLPSMLFMGLLFIASGLAADIWKERTQGTLRRVASSPMSMTSYLAARVVFVALVYLVAGILGLWGADRLAGMPVPNLPAAVLWMTFVGTVFYLLFLWIAVQASTQRGASVLANLIIFPLAMLGGSFFPFEWMPAWMVSVGKLTPNGWALTTFKAILNSSVETTSLIVSAALLAAFGAVAFFFTLRRIVRVFAV